MLFRSAIAFVRKVIPGVADKSYGVHVAKLAGLPKEVVMRAEALTQERSSNSPSVSLSFPPGNVVTAEDAHSHYIRIDKKSGTFPEAFDLLYSLTIPHSDNPKE